MGPTYPTVKHYKRRVPVLQSPTARLIAAPQIKQPTLIFLAIPLPSLATAVCSSFGEAFYFYLKSEQATLSIN